MAPVAIGVGLLGTAFSVAGKLKEASVQAEQLEFTAREAEAESRKADFNAQLTREKTFDDIKTMARENAQVLGSIRVAYGASGVTMDGTPTEYIENQAAIGRSNLLALYHKGTLEARAYKDQGIALRRQAEQYRLGAGNVKDAGTISAIGAGLAGGYSVGKDVFGGRSALRRTA